MTNINQNTNKPTSNTNNAAANEWQKREIGALWKKTGKTQKFLAGHFDIDEFGSKRRVKVVIFSNKSKNSDKQPDFRIFLSEEPNVATTAPTQAVKNLTQAVQTKTRQQAPAEQASTPDEELI